MGGGVWQKKNPGLDISSDDIAWPGHQVAVGPSTWVDWTYSVWSGRTRSWSQTEAALRRVEFLWVLRFERHTVYFSGSSQVGPCVVVVASPWAPFFLCTFKFHVSNCFFVSLFRTWVLEVADSLAASLASTQSRGGLMAKLLTPVLALTPGNDEVKPQPCHKKVSAWLLSFSVLSAVDVQLSLKGKFDCSFFFSLIPC